jgi:hypothetical protein
MLNGGTRNNAWRNLDRPSLVTAHLTLTAGRRLTNSGVLTSYHWAASRLTFVMR